MHASGVTSFEMIYTIPIDFAFLIVLNLVFLICRFELLCQIWDFGFLDMLRCEI